MCWTTFTPVETLTAKSPPWGRKKPHRLILPGMTQRSQGVLWEHLEVVLWQYTWISVVSFHHVRLWHRGEMVLRWRLHQLRNDFICIVSTSDGNQLEVYSCELTSCHLILCWFVTQHTEKHIFYDWTACSFTQVEFKTPETFVIVSTLKKASFSFFSSWTLWEHILQLFCHPKLEKSVNVFWEGG